MLRGSQIDRRVVRACLAARAGDLCSALCVLLDLNQLVEALNLCIPGLHIHLSVAEPLLQLGYDQAVQLGHILTVDLILLAYSIDHCRQLHGIDGFVIAELPELIRNLFL
jgi:hypothetical protein